MPTEVLLGGQGMTGPELQLRLQLAEPPELRALRRARSLHNALLASSGLVAFVVWCLDISLLLGGAGSVHR